MDNRVCATVATLVYVVPPNIDIPPKNNIQTAAPAPTSQSHKDISHTSTESFLRSCPAVGRTVRNYGVFIGCTCCLP